ncbi:MAG: Stp1/IreP family PP2C-type Ser/Thr phosphatase [Coriobacteriales bacterium]|jgi:protein phosphatase|nr:Stp1/IreP family PP2C-type Ser/Thr phosphatase [Coriobacteriales bacterium]
MTTLRRARRPDPANVAGARTDVGCVRQHNEDALIVAAPLYAVADGMGGHAAGEVASEIAIQTVAQHAPSIADRSVLIQAIQAANLAIIDAARRGVGKPGMGTTLTVAIIDGDRALIGHVGDSRAYLLRDGLLHQITEDHSLVAELVAIGELTPEEAACHPKRSIITRALGNDEKTDADVYSLALQAADRLLLCSDGLSGMLCDDEMAAILNAESDPQIAADRLTEAALAAGGNDNISVIVLNIYAIRPSRAATAAALAANSGPTVELREGSAADVKRRGQRSRLGVITFVALFVLLIAGAVGGVWLYANNTAFLRLENNQVQVYRGLPGDILPGVRLEWFENTTDLNRDDLLVTIAEELETGIRFDNLDAAYLRVADLQASRDEKRAETAGAADAANQSGSATARAAGLRLPGDASINAWVANWPEDGRAMINRRLPGVAMTAATHRAASSSTGNVAKASR